MSNDIENNLILLDIYVIIWALIKPEELPKPIKQIISTAQEKKQLLIASISLWEIAMLKNKKRLNIYEPTREFLQSIVNIEGIRVTDISPLIAADSASLADGFHGDPADRIITATAITEGAYLLTRDKQILSWAELVNIRTIKC